MNNVSRTITIRASSGNNFDPSDQVEDFTAFPGCTAGTDTFNTKDIYIYPNPTNSIFNLKVNGYSGKLSIKVIDLNGRVILEDNEDNASSIKTINLSAFQAGMYIVKGEGEGLNCSKELIKN